MPRCQSCGKTEGSSFTRRSKPETDSSIRPLWKSDTARSKTSRGCSACAREIVWKGRKPVANNKSVTNGARWTFSRARRCTLTKRWHPMQEFRQGLTRCRSWVNLISLELGGVSPQRGQLDSRLRGNDGCAATHSYRQTHPPPRPRIL